MKVLLTGAFGNVGRSTLDELIARGHEVRILEMKTRRTEKVARRYLKSHPGRVGVQWGDIRNIADVGEAVAGVDAIIHVAAIIPPLAERKPLWASYINTGGTENLIRAAGRLSTPPRFVFTSSISIYGDRRAQPLILPSDDPCPNHDDEYAKQKLAAEKALTESKLPWTILRLTYIVSPGKLQMDPLMFSMPLETSIEICHTRDVGRALATSLVVPASVGKVLHIAGGERCRTTYREYLRRMLSLFGLGRGFLPDEAFSIQPFHCGFMDTEESERLLNFQRTTLDEYYAEVGRVSRFKRFWIRLVRPIARNWIMYRSPVLRNYLKTLGDAKRRDFLRALSAAIRRRAVNMKGV